MAISKKSRDAMLQILKILAPRQSPETRTIASRNVATFSQKGQWISAFTIDQIAVLFYPNDRKQETDFLEQMTIALDAGTLLSTIGKDGGKFVLTRENFAQWEQCPAVPSNSPLRHWLPQWMSAPASKDALLASHAPTPVMDTAFRGKTPARRDVLTPVIEQAQRMSIDPTDTAAVWNNLVYLAENETFPLINSTHAGLKYSRDDKTKFLTREHLHKRLLRIAGKAGQQHLPPTPANRR